MHNHDVDSEACLNRQILNNSVRRKAVEDLCGRPHKLIHRELQSQHVDTLTYEDIRNSSRNMHKARSSNRYWRNSWSIKYCTSVNNFDRTCLLMARGKNYCNVFLPKKRTVFFSPIDGLYVYGTFKSAPKFFHQLFTIHGLTMCNLHFSYRPINFQRPMRMYSDIRCQMLQNLVWMFFQQLFMLTSKQPFTTQWQECYQAWKLKHVVSI